ncbi:hypothetical protein F4779DRAFT_263357 [Xylariaceae sp. FL0662B]|nr:hypothetical protein F4779DRAFT_263357 [Xylariaceae sp. FL0662B]
MSSETQPISPTRFAEALKDLPAGNLALKVLELRNSIAHLDYSNAELKPYAEGRPPSLDQQDVSSQVLEPDRDCIDAIAENEVVIARMQERIELIRAEVESRGLNWLAFQGKEDDETPTDAANANANANAEETSAAANLTNGVNGNGGAEQAQQHEAWRDGTFQTGTISSIGEEERELLRQLQSRIPPEDEDEDPEGGMHL